MGTARMRNGGGSMRRRGARERMERAGGVGERVGGRRAPWRWRRIDGDGSASFCGSVGLYVSRVRGSVGSSGLSSGVAAVCIEVVRRWERVMIFRGAPRRLF